MARCRREISAKTGVAGRDILISVTHTHSGPKMLDPLATAGDEAAAKTDPPVVRFIEERIVEAACRAVENPTAAEAGLAGPKHFGLSEAGVQTIRRAHAV